MGFKFRNCSWQRRVGVIVGVVLPCLLWWGMWEVGSWRPQVLTGEGVISAIEFSPSEPLLACTAWDGGFTSVQMWDSRRKKLLWNQRSGVGNDTLAFSPDGKLLVTATPLVTLWDVHTGKQRRVLHDTKLPSGAWFSFSADGHSLIVHSGVARVSIYDLATGQIQSQTPTLRYEGDRLRVLNQAHPRSYKGTYRELTHWVVAPNWKWQVKRLDRCTYDYGYISENGCDLSLDPEIWLCDAQGRFQSRLQGAGAIHTFSSDSRRLLTGGSGEAGESQLQLWDVETKKRVRRFLAPLPEPGARIGLAGFSTDGTRIFGGVSDNSSLVTIVIWEIASGRIIRQFSLEPIPLAELDLALSPDNSQIAVTAVNSDVRRNKLRLWRVE